MDNVSSSYSGVRAALLNRYPLANQFADSPVRIESCSNINRGFADGKRTI